MGINSEYLNVLLNDSFKKMIIHLLHLFRFFMWCYESCGKEKTMDCNVLTY